jgi:hypothetical protein
VGGGTGGKGGAAGLDKVEGWRGHGKPRSRLWEQSMNYGEAHHVGANISFEHWGV